MMMKKALFVVLVTILAGLLVGCGGDDPPEPPPPPPTPTAEAGPAGPPPDPTAAELSNLIRVGVNPGEPPFVVKEAEDRFVGFDVDLMNRIVQAAGLEVDYVEEPDFFALFVNLADDRFDGYDVAISQLSITPERADMVDFSQAYFETGQAIVVRQDSAVTDPADLESIGVQKNTSGHAKCLERYAAQEEVEDICRPFSSLDQAIEALLAGQVEAVIFDFPTLFSLAGQNPQLKILGDLFSKDRYGIAVRKSRPDLLAAINAGLAAAVASGAYRQYCADWIEVTDQCVLAPSSSEPAAVEEPASQPTPAAGPVPTALAPPPTEPAAKPEFPILACDIRPAASGITGQAYTIQAGDWLSLVAEREYGNPLDYRAIVEYNNLQCQADSTFTCLQNPDQIEVGWTVYLPTMAQVEAYWAGQFVGLPPVDWGVSGDIQVGGSSTVYPLTRQLKICFEEKGFTGTIDLPDPTGTLEGFRQFCNGELDILDASVPLDGEYRELCQANGIVPVEFQIGTDAVAIAVSRQNDFVAQVTLEELKAILATADLWSKVRPDWPNQPIKRYYPTAQSGTFEALADILFAGDGEVLSGAPNLILTSEDDQILAAELENDPYAVGFFGYAYYALHSDRLRTLPVDGIQPRPETVDAGTYPLLRPLFIYSSQAAIDEKPQVAQFINFYLTTVKNYVTDVGYFLPDEAALAEGIERFNEAAE